MIAHEWRDPGDERVFGAVFATQRVDGEAWLVRGVLRVGDTGPPILARVSIEHFQDPGREVTGAIVREIRFGAIRDQALVRLRERATNLGLMSGVPAHVVTVAQQAAEKAGHGGIAVGPRGAYPIEHYRRIAERYLALVAGGRRDVLNALCEEESRRLGEQVGRERMRDWVKKATKLGFLAPGKQGSVGREPGPNLKTKGASDG